MYSSFKVIANVEGNVPFSPFITKVYMQVTPIVEGMNSIMY